MDQGTSKGINGDQRYLNPGKNTSKRERASASARAGAREGGRAGASVRADRYLPRALFSSLRPRAIQDEKKAERSRGQKCIHTVEVLDGGCTLVRLHPPRDFLSP